MAWLGGWTAWKGRLLGAGLVLGLLAGMALLAVAAGLVPVAASEGHWPVTRWFLHVSMERSVSTHARFQTPEPPDLSDPALILRGAGHFVQGCQPCHGGPDAPSPPLPGAMVPPPPYLPETVPEWRTDELFYLVQHGIKMTGMPAWPGGLHREDEVWAVVAFLRRLPELDSEGFRRLAYGGTVDADPPPRLARLDAQGLETPGLGTTLWTSCARCHGVEGWGRGEGAFPHLAGQKAAYLEMALRSYAGEARPSGLMQTPASRLGEAEIRAVARYYASRPAPPPAVDRVELGAEGRAAVERGAQIAARGVPARKVPSCADCHGPLEVADRPEPSPHYPHLAGQPPGYLEGQLKLFRSGHRGGGEYAHLMHEAAAGLSDDHIRDVALYYASLPRD